jgi:hypothetical protein
MKLDSSCFKGVLEHVGNNFSPDGSGLPHVGNHSIECELGVVVAVLAIFVILLWWWAVLPFFTNFSVFLIITNLGNGVGINSSGVRRGSESLLKGTELGHKVHGLVAKRLGDVSVID